LLLVKVSESAVQQTPVQSSRGDASQRDRRRTGWMMIPVDSPA